MPQQGFDVNAARQAGYSDDEILAHLTQSRNFDVNSALSSGYSKGDVINYLSSTPARPDFAANPPGVQRPVPQALQGPPNAPQPSFLQSLGRSPLRPTPQDTQAYQEHPTAMTAAGVGGIGLGVAGATAPATVPFLGRLAANAGKNIVRNAPGYIGAGLASEGINYVRQHIPGGKYIPAGAEWLPWLSLGAHGEPATEGGKPPVYPGAPEPTIPPAVEQGMPLRNVPPTGAQAAAETGEALGTVSKPNLAFLPSPGAPEPPAPRITQKAVQGQIERGLGYQPTEIKPGVPLRNQGTAYTPVESSALKSYSYDPDTQEFTATTQGGQTYIHGDVSPEEAQAFADAKSKGQVWQQIRSNPLVGKVVNGKRIAMRPGRMNQ